MRYLRSILSLILVVITTLLVSCSGPAATTPPPTYTPEKIAQLEILVAPVDAARARMSELGKLIEAKNWVDTITIIHGPIGGIRRDMKYLTESLLVKDQKQASQLSKKLFGDFERIDAAAKDRTYFLAKEQYEQALADFDAYLKLIPRVSDDA